MDREQLETFSLKIYFRLERITAICGKRLTVISNRTERKENFPFVPLRSVFCIPFCSIPSEKASINEPFMYELFKSPVDAWFKLLSQEEGEFYNVQILPENEEQLEALRRRAKMEAVNRSPVSGKMDISDGFNSIKDRDRVQLSDFTFLSVIGKGSFGK
uniref:Uncharacterized protein n=1 Tax=Romanomermis culicivorax TaxID=13658 RepID=A0A915HPY2_ROMCU